MTSGRAVTDWQAHFWALVDKRGPSECWPWLGRKNDRGYGLFDGKPRPGGGSRLESKAHRFAWESLVGPIPAGHEIDHGCLRRDCCNPAHMECVTRAEHLARIRRDPLTGRLVGQKAWIQ